MYFQTGDIITARVKSLPLFLHHGIVVVNNDGTISVYHNTPMLKNSSGGGVVKEDIEEWILSRDIIDVEQTGLSREFIEQKSYELSDRPFNLFSFNCEQYIALLRDGRRKSPQLLFFISGIAICLLFKGK